MLEISGDLSGIFMFLLDETFTQNILNALLGEEERELVALDEMSSSAVCEIGNVMWRRLHQRPGTADGGKGARICARHLL